MGISTELQYATLDDLYLDAKKQNLDLADIKLIQIILKTKFLI